MTTEETVTTAVRDEHSPRAKLRHLGMSALSDAELLALLLDRGRSHEDALALATSLLQNYGGTRSLGRAGVGEIAFDVGNVRAARVAGAFELGRRAMSEPLSTATALRSSRDVVRAFAPRLIERSEECVLVVLLDARQRPIAEREIAHGGPASCAIGVREIFALAVREAATAIVLVHNHPSGEPTPSDDDVRLTRALVEAGRVLELPLVDHVIVGREGSFSFLDAGLLPMEEAAK